MGITEAKFLKVDLDDTDLKDKVALGLGLWVI